MARLSLIARTTSQKEAFRPPRALCRPTLATNVKGKPQQPRRPQATNSSAELSTKLALAAAAGSALALLMPSLPASADMEAGKSVFNQNCTACHMGGRNSVIADRTLDREAIEKYLKGGFTIEAIEYQVSNGKGAMPAWQDILDEDEIKDVAEYVYTTAKADGWPR